MNWILTFLKEFALRLKASSPKWFVRLRYISIALAAALTALVQAFPPEVNNLVIIPLVNWTLATVLNTLATLLIGMWVTSFTTADNKVIDVENKL